MFLKFVISCHALFGNSQVFLLLLFGDQLFKKTVTELMSEGKVLLPLPDVSGLATAYFERLPKGTPLKREGISPRLYLTAAPGPTSPASTFSSATTDSIRYIFVDFPFE